MSRSIRLRLLTLTSCVTCALLAACSDGVIDGVYPGGSTAGGGAYPGAGSPAIAGSFAVGGSGPSAGASSAGVANVPHGGQSSAGSNAGGTNGVNAGGVSATAGTPGLGGMSQGGVAGSAAAGSGNGGRGGTGGSSGSGNQEPDCGDDEDECGGACVDVSSSEQHCGGCNKPCSSNQECDGGSCQCTGELTLCGSSCLNTDGDPQNCGSCGNKCATGATCSDGKCSGGSTGGGVTACSSISDFGVISDTIVVKSGQTYDGKCKRYRADASELGDGSQEEGQQPMFRVEGGGKLINVVLGAPAADGIHTEGNVTLENITWEDIGEDALTIKEGGTVVLNGGSAKNGADKVFQINAASTFRVSNFKASNAGKFIRQLGGSTFKTQVFIDSCDISDMKEAIFRTDSSSSTVSMTNTRYHAIGESRSSA